MSSRRPNIPLPLWPTSSVSNHPRRTRSFVSDIPILFSDYVTRANCTVEHVTPLVEELKVVLTNCITDLHALVGVDVNILLLNAVGVKVTTAVVARLLADIFIVSIPSTVTKSSF